MPSSGTNVLCASTSERFSKWRIAKIGQAEAVGPYIKRSSYRIAQEIHVRIQDYIEITVHPIQRAF